jgi:putative acetyltransferase
MRPGDAEAITLRRPRGEEDVVPAARLHRASMRAAMPWLAEVHTPDEDVVWMREVIFATQSVWLACAGEAIVGVASRKDTWLTQLYVAPGWTGRGIGARLLERIAGESATIDLWTFQRNAGARRFYEREGFTAVEFTDGAGNEEREPDVRYVRRRR